MSQIRIVRVGFGDFLRKYKVFIDGQQAGELKRSSEIAIDVSPGLHTVKLTIDWVGSRDVSVFVKEGQSRVLSCQSAGPSKPHWIDLGIADDEQNPPVAQSSDKKLSEHGVMRDAAVVPTVQRLDEQMLGLISIEVAMFMRWMEEKRNRMLAPEEIEDIARRILVRESRSFGKEDVVHIVNLALASELAPVDAARRRTGFDQTIDGFCRSIGIRVP